MSCFFVRAVHFRSVFIFHPRRRMQPFSFNVLHFILDTRFCQMIFLMRFAFVFMCFLTFPPSFQVSLSSFSAFCSFLSFFLLYAHYFLFLFFLFFSFAFAFISDCFVFLFFLFLRTSCARRAHVLRTSCARLGMISK